MLENNIRLFIRKHSLIQQNERVLVAYSGGPDSTCLLIVLQKLFPNTHAVYVNHQLRGQESQREEQFVRDFCSKHGISLFVERIRWNSPPSNLEEAARKRRYRHLEKVASEHGFSKIALAHHKDDAAETFLLNLIRGSGPAGLAGISPKRGRYVRPMLECGRSEILHYLQEREIAFFQDTSNSNLQFSRNKIRQELIPYISRNFNPAFSSAIERAARWVGEQNELILDLLRPYESLLEFSNNGWSLNRKHFLALTSPLQKAVLRMQLLKMDPALRLSSRSLEHLLEAIQTGKAYELPGALKMDKHGAFSFKRRRPGLVEIDVPAEGTYNFSPGNLVLKFSIERRKMISKPNVALLDADAAAFPLYIRNWKSGDFFKPLGMKGTKKLSDYFIDRKIPREARKLIPLVFKDDDLLWVAGHQIHEDYRITPSTRSVLRIEAKEIG